jgi:L-asparaginase
MVTQDSFERDRQGNVVLKSGTGGNYDSSLQAGGMLANIKTTVPEVNHFANVSLKVAFNRDSSRVGPSEWVKLAQLLHKVNILP